jgi:hypothetical protein
MFAVIKDQMVTAAADLAERSVNDGIPVQPVAMGDHVNLVTTAAGDDVDRSLLDFKVGSAASRARHAAVTIGEVDDGAVTKVDGMMLKRHAQVGAPNKKMVAFGHKVSSSEFNPSYRGVMRTYRFDLGNEPAQRRFSSLFTRFARRSGEIPGIVANHDTLASL